MLKAYVEGGLLDKILKTTVGELLNISPAEANGILASDIHRCTGGIEICMAIHKGMDFTLLGRKIHVSY